MSSFPVVSSFTLALMLEKIVEISKISNVMDTLEELAASLELTEALLSDAGRRRNMDNQTIPNFLKKLDAVASDGLNLLDKVEYIALKGKLQHKPYCFVSMSYHYMFPKIAMVKSKVDAVYSELLQMGLRLVNDTNSGAEIKQMAPTDSSVIESEVVGRASDVKNVVEMLLKSDSGEKISVISVVGMAGMGKTTLAQLVYNNVEIDWHFYHRIWISVGADFNGERILKEMLEYLTLKTVDVSSRGAILELLRKELQGRSYLLVLDDVWNENQEWWDSLRKCFQDMDSSNRSKILVTTRNHGVTSVMRSSVNYKLRLLPFGASLELFQRIAFADCWPNQIPDLDDNINRIVKRCQGLPLAVKTIAGLVYSGIKLLNLKNAGTSWSPFETPNEILFTAFNRSYESLPSLAVKQCFAYCCLFPKQSLLEKGKLVQLWMAQGFINVLREQCQEMDLGDEYFNLLTYRSMLQEVEKVFGYVKSCKMHYLDHEFASSLSENFCLISEAGEVDAGTLSRAVHLYLICWKRKTPQFGRKSLPMLRTLILEGGFLPRRLIGIEYIRVLILSDQNARQLPRSIGYLKHLRYLDISKTSIERLPNSITQLYYLQTLRLYTVVEMPRYFGKLVNLRHLYIEKVFHNDRHCLLPSIGELVNLRTIPFFVVSQEKGCQIFELGPLQFLKGELKIFGLENVKDGEVASRTNLSTKSHIGSLELHWDSPSNREGVSNDEVILEGLRPNSNLQSLTIINFDGSQFPSWIAGTRESLLLSNLVTIKLQNCNRCADVPALGHLPSLKVVQIDTLNNVTYISEKFYDIKLSSVTSNRFSVLEELTVVGMSSLRVWSEPTSMAVFRSLKKLTVKDCPQLTSLPEVFKCAPLQLLSIINCGKLKRLPEGLSGIGSLKYLEILHCNYLEEIPSLGRLTALRELCIVNCTKLRALPTGIEECEWLKDLHILSCPVLQIDGYLHCIKFLRKLEVGCFSADLDYFPWPCSISSIKSSAEIEVLSLSKHFSSLTSLKLCGWPKLTSLPEQVKHIPALKNLHLCLFDGLEVLPEWLGEIKALATLILEDCWNLTHLPSAKLTNLVKLTILRCPLLEQRCATTTGAEWYKIKHIPHVHLGHREWESQT